MSSTVTAPDIALKSVLVAFDFSQPSQKPLHHALAIARHYGAKFYLSHVVSGRGYTIAVQEALNLAAAKTPGTAEPFTHVLRTTGALATLHHSFHVREGNI